MGALVAIPDVIVDEGLDVVGVVLLELVVEPLAVLTVVPRVVFTGSKHATTCEICSHTYNDLSRRTTSQRIKLSWKALKTIVL